MQYFILDESERHHAFHISDASIRLRPFGELHIADIEVVATNDDAAEPAVLSISGIVVRPEGNTHYSSSTLRANVTLYFFEHNVTEDTDIEVEHTGNLWVLKFSGAISGVLGPPGAKLRIETPLAEK